MALSKVTDGNFDTVAGNVPAPYGPVTRVGSVPDHDYNSDVKIECTSALSVTFYASYDDLNDTDRQEDVLAAAHGGRDMNHLGWLTALGVEVLHEHIESWAGPPFLDTEWQTMIGALRYFQHLVGFIPITAYSEIEGGQLVKITASAADSATPNEADLTLTIDGVWALGLIDWKNDGTEITLITPDTDLSSPIAHDFGGTGAQTIRIVAIGPGGHKEALTSVTVA